MESADLTQQRESAAEGPPARLPEESELPQSHEEKVVPEMLCSYSEMPIHSKRFEQECLPDREQESEQEYLESVPELECAEMLEECLPDCGFSTLTEELFTESLAVRMSDVFSVAREPAAAIILEKFEQEYFAPIPERESEMPLVELEAAIALEQFEQERSPDPADSMPQREPFTEPSEEREIFQEHPEVEVDPELRHAEPDAVIALEQFEQERLPDSSDFDCRDGAERHQWLDNSAVSPGTDTDPYMVTSLGFTQPRVQALGASRCLEPDAAIRGMSRRDDVEDIRVTIVDCHQSAFEPIIRPIEEAQNTQLAEVWPKPPFEEVDLESSPRNDDSTGLRVCFPFNRRRRSGEPERKDDSYDGERLEAGFPLLSLERGSRLVEGRDESCSEIPRDVKPESGCYAVYYY